MKKVFAELARRQVFRVAAAYSVVGWILLQIVGLLAPGLGLPEWTLALVFTILAVGFPLAVLLAWAFELTPEGVSRIEAVDASETRIKPADAGFLGVLVLVLLVSSIGFFRSDSTRDFAPIEIADVETDRPSRLAIAVLPFADMSPEGDQDWFSDGISEEIIHRLALEKNLTVAGRTSSFYFKDKNVPFEEIGRMLNVGTVLEGSVRKDGPRVRITAQLIDIQSGAHRWSGTFDRELKDIFRIQEDLSVSIARELLRELGVEPTVPEAKPYEPNIEAFQAYLRGRKVIGNYTPKSFIETVEWMERAMELDGSYLDPAAYLVGMISRTQGPGGFLPDGFRDIDSLFEEALHRQPTDVDTSLMRAFIASSKWQFIEANREFHNVLIDKTAGIGEIESVANFLLQTGRTEQALPLYRDVIKRDPFNPDPRLWLVVSLNSTGRYKEAIEAAKEAADLGMNSPFLADNRAIAEGLTGNPKAMERVIEEYRGVLGDVEIALATTFLYYLKNDTNGLKEFEQDFLRMEKQKETAFDPMLLANIYIFLGDIDNALPWLKRAIKIKSFLFRSIVAGPLDWPMTAFLTRDPRGLALLEEAGYDLDWFDAVD